jgi:FAD/FMN-containing dehydrogenase
MGLTGVIVRAGIRLRPVESAWVRQTTIRAPDLRSAIKAFEDGHRATYSVAWIDCMGQGRHLGRSLVMMGEHALRRELPTDKARAPFRTSARPQISVPFDLPGNLLNGLTVRAFNALYYAAGAGGRAQQLVDWDRYFYPLDAITGWNRIYGSGGFAQFQCVLPLDRAEAGLRALLAQTARAGSGSFLAVLKRMGPQESAFSFPMEGYTLALDFPVNRKTLALLERLDQITLEHGGRFYLAKDSRMKAATLAASDNRVADFRAKRLSRGLVSRFRSAQAERLDL